MFVRLPLLTSLLCCAFLIASTPVDASLSFVSTRAALAGSDFVDWGAQGFNQEDLINNPFNAISNLGVNVNVSKLQTSNFQLRNQPDNYASGFSDGDNLLYTTDTVGNLDTVSVMDFDGNGVTAVGAHIKPFDSNTLNTYDATIEAFDSGDVSLGSVTVLGVSADTSVFLGVTDDTDLIHKVKFNVKLTTALGGVLDSPFLINRLDFTSFAPPTIPEPTTAMIWSVMLGCCCLGIRRRKQA